jgi:hypothetical protein
MLQLTTSEEFTSASISVSIATSRLWISLMWMWLEILVSFLIREHYGLSNQLGQMSA